jgi:hypothetical protein
LPVNLLASRRDGAAKLRLDEVSGRLTLGFT